MLKRKEEALSSQPRAGLLPTVEILTRPDPTPASFACQETFLHQAPRTQLKPQRLQKRKLKAGISFLAKILACVWIYGVANQKETSNDQSSLLRTRSLPGRFDRCRGSPISRLSNCAALRFLTGNTRPRWVLDPSLQHYAPRCVPHWLGFLSAGCPSFSALCRARSCARNLCIAFNEDSVPSSVPSS